MTRDLGARVTRRLVGAVATALVLVGVAAAPAFAHAVLEGTDPAIGGAVERSPSAITLKYSEPVEASLGAIRVYDAKGSRVETGAPKHPGGVASEVRASVPTLADGAYVVTWRVISADSHPVRGAYTFTVGAATTTGAVKGLAARLLSEQGGSSTVGVLFAVARFATFAGLALLLGAAAFLAFVWPEGRGSRRAAAITWTGWLAAFVASAASFALQGAYASALSLGDVFRPSLWGDVWGTRYGHVVAARILLLLVALPILRALLPRGHGPVREHPLPAWWPTAAGAVAVALVVTPGLAGHAAEGMQAPLALVADALHVGGVCLWLGGLVVLGLALLPEADVETLRRAVPRYSQLALGAVVAIVLSGSYQAWRQVGSLQAAVDTDYGRILLVKLGVFAGLVIAAAFSRDLVNQQYREPLEADADLDAEPVAVGAASGVTIGAPSGTTFAPSRPDDLDAAFERAPIDDATAARRLRRSVLIEVLLAVVILVVTALLVNAAPARTVESGPWISTIKTESLWFDVNIVPGRFGPNDIHLSALLPSGGPQDTLSMEAELTNPDRNIGPLAVPLRRLAPGHYTSPGFDIPFSGTWTLTVKALVTDTDEVVGRERVTIR